MSHSALTLKEFLENFVAEHALIDGNDLVLVVSPEDMEALGQFFVRGICGWALGIDLKPLRCQLVEVTPHFFDEDLPTIDKRLNQNEELPPS